MSDNTDHFPAGPALVAVAVLIAAAVFSGPTRAAARPLSDDEMSGVRGADGSIVAALQGTPSSGGGNAFTNGLAQAFTSSTGATVLDATAFGAALQSAGWPAGTPMPGYQGQPVMQTRVDAPPVTFSFDLSALLQAGTGLAVTGPSMGTITVRDFDARGTTLWVWQHH